MSRTSPILAGVCWVGLTILLFDIVADLWPAIGVQSDVCARVQNMTGPDTPEYTEARAHREGAGRYILMAIDGLKEQP